MTRSSKGFFYSKTRRGSSVVDFCITLFRDEPVPCIANVREDLPNVVGRGTVRNYGRWESGIVYVTLIYGYGIPRLVMTLSLKGTQAPGVTLSLKGMQAPGVTLSLEGT